MSNSNNRLIVFASILGAILATGLLALDPSLIIINAGAQMYGDPYDYRDDYNNDYYPNDYQYGYEDNRRNYYNEDYNDNDYYVYDDDDDEYSDIQLEFGDKYGNYNNKDYSKHPTKDHKFVCKTGQFKGFHVKSPDVCNLEIPEGPEGPEGPQGEQGIRGPAGTAGPNIISSTSLYKVERSGIAGSNAQVFCDLGDIVLNGGFAITNVGPDPGIPTASFPVGTEAGNNFDSWISALRTQAGSDQIDNIASIVVCFDNPPEHMP